MERAAEIVKRDHSGNNPIFLVEYVSAEQNVETMGYFSAHYKRRYPRDRQASKVITLPGGRRLEIIPSGKYGFPNTDDLDFYRAFLKICDERATTVQEEQDGQITFHPKLPSPIGFRTRELIVKAGRTKSAREMAAVREWIERLNATIVHGELYDAKTQKYNAKIGLEPLFRKFAHVGRPMENGEIASMNYVWLADWFVDNYFYYYVRRVDLKFYQQLRRPIAKALYPILDNGWFAATGGAFSKRYADLCTILDIQTYKQISRVQQQLNPSHDELVRHQFVASYEYPLDEHGKWTGIVTWYPGRKWFYDQEQKKRPREITLSSEQTSALALLPSVDDTAPVGPQILLPLPPDVMARHAAYTERIVQFYGELGYPRVPQQKINAGVKLLTDLVENQRYSWEDIELALAWIVKNRSKFAGHVYSLNLLPHVIDQALQEENKQRVQDKKQLSLWRDREQLVVERVRLKSLEERLELLSQAEREQLHKRAVESLVSQGIKKRFLEMGSLIRSETLRLLSESVTLSPHSPAKRPEPNA